MASGGIAGVTFRSNEIATGVRDALGRFTRFQKQMRVAHGKMAENAAVQIVKVLQERIEDTGRPQVERTRHGQGEERLLRDLLNEGNRTSGYGGFTVVRPEFMEESPANEYYRGLEEGSSRFVGRQFRGVFIEPGVRGASEASRRHQAIMVIHGSGGVLPGEEQVGEHGFGGGAYGTRRGETKTNAIPAKSLFAPLRGREGEGHGLITIKNPIPAYHYIETGFSNWVSSDDELKQTQLAASEAGLAMEGTRIVPPILTR